MLKDKVQDRLANLLVSAESIKSTKIKDQPVTGVLCNLYTRVNSEQATKWITSVITIFRSTFGEESYYYKRVLEFEDKCWDWNYLCQACSVVESVLEDIKGDYFFESKQLLEAEVYSNFLDQSEALLNSGYKDAAAVIVGGVLEQHLRSMCAKRNISLLKSNGGNKMINEMNDDLARVPVFNLHVKKQISTWADIRNNAAHGNYSAYQKTDVEFLLNGIRRFCSDYS